MRIHGLDGKSTSTAEHGRARQSTTVAVVIAIDSLKYNRDWHRWSGQGSLHFSFSTVAQGVVAASTSAMLQYEQTTLFNLARACWNL